jgi:RNA polymerase sigma-70 factor, ECF subfamily
VISRQEFKVHFDKWYNPLCNYALRFVNDRQRAADIVQDVFLYIWEKRDTIAFDEGFKSYLFQTTYHRALNFIRKEQKIPIVELSNADNSECRDSDNFDKEADLLEKKELIVKSLRHLPTKCKEVFVLSRQNGLSYTEIAETLNISKKTVESHMVKALSILRNNLKKH